MMPNADHLIYDLGCHTGQDSDFYLRKGFTVVAVEANPELCDQLKERFGREIAEGRYVLIEKAVGERFGKVEFFVNTERSIWGATAYNPRYRERSSAKVSPNWTKTVVPSIPFSWLTDQFGVPYYLKIDIEGADVLCLEDLMKEEDRPNFISIERQPFLADQLKELALLKALGYTRFKIVDQLCTNSRHGQRGKAFTSSINSNSTLPGFSAKNRRGLGSPIARRSPATLRSRFKARASACGDEHPA